MCSPIYLAILAVLLFEVKASTGVEERDFVCPELKDANFDPSVFNGHCINLNGHCLEKHKMDYDILTKFRNVSCNTDPQIIIYDPDPYYIKAIQVAFEDQVANELFRKAVCLPLNGDSGISYNPNENTFRMYMNYWEKISFGSYSNIDLVVPCSEKLMKFVKKFDEEIITLPNVLFQGILSTPRPYFNEANYQSIVKSLLEKFHHSKEANIKEAVQKVRTLFNGDYKKPLRLTRQIKADDPNRGAILETYANYSERPEGDHTSMVHVCQGFRQYFGPAVADAKESTNELKLKAALIKYCDEHIQEKKSRLVLIYCFICFSILLVCCFFVRLKFIEASRVARRKAKTFNKS